MRLPIYRCTRCGHQWIPRTKNPKYCPACNSPYWNKQKVKQSGRKRKK